MLDRERLITQFLNLVAIDSISRNEQAIALRLKEEMEALGAAVEIDDAGIKVGGNVGNVIAHVRGTVPSAAALLLCAHMDTVVPGEGIKPIVDGEIVRTDGSTILAGDDKSGITIILEVIRVLKERNLPHGDLEVVFTICEEVGMLGAKHLDLSRVRSRAGMVLDSERLQHLITKAPAANEIKFRVHGLESHAGICPERGISAIQVAAEALVKMKLGRIDHETTANIGVVQGGFASNIVPNLVVMMGEARSHDESKLEAQTAHMRQCLKEAAANHRLQVDGKIFQASVEEDIKRDFPSMNVFKDSKVVQLVLKAAGELGIPMELAALGGGFDANIFNEKEIETVSLGTGMREIHALTEWLDVRETLQAARLVLEVILLNARIG